MKLFNNEVHTLGAGSSWTAVSDAAKVNQIIQELTTSDVEKEMSSLILEFSNLQKLFKLQLSPGDYEKFHDGVKGMKPSDVFGEMTQVVSGLIATYSDHDLYVIFKEEWHGVTECYNT